MYQINKKAKAEDFSYDRLYNTLEELKAGLYAHIDVSAICNKVENGLYHGISIEEFFDLAAQETAYMASIHYDYSKLAARIALYMLYKKTANTFTEAIDALHYYKSKGRICSSIDNNVYEFIMSNKDALNNAIVTERDHNFDFFGFMTLKRSYLLKINKDIVERPQYVFMRVSCGINCGNLEETIHMYNLMSQGYYTHATPSLFNSGTINMQMSSCFLLQMEDDSIEGIYSTLKSCAIISKHSGGIGLAIQKIRARGSYIAGTNGISNGIVPMLQVFNSTARYVDQGGGRRKGSFAIYIEPWHGDIYEFLELRKNHGKEENRARDLFYALWINDIFMRRVNNDEDWCLMCPNVCYGLPDVWGAEFDELYEKYEREKKYIRKVKARHLWEAILRAQIETGTPYMLYKDSVNRKSNQQNLGTIQCSNLCTEIMQYTSPDEITLCNLASIALPKFVNTKTKTYDYNHLHEIAKVVTINLNKVIDKNFYIDEKTKKSNLTHRPIGIGVQGLADVYQMLFIPYDSEEANTINRNIFETIYHGSMTASIELAKQYGAYKSYQGSPFSKGKFQFDLWNEDNFEKGLPPVKLSGMYDWEETRKELLKYGARNSLLLAPMPTASTSQILGNSESFDPYVSNVFIRKVLSGEFCIFNKHLMDALIKRGLWNDGVKEEIIAHDGSIQHINYIDNDLKQVFKTVWEIKQKTYIDHSITRGPFICQGQSLSLYVENPSYAKLTSMHFYAWKNGLKTGMYYLRTKSPANALKFTIDQKVVKAAIAAKKKNIENSTPKNGLKVDECNLDSSSSCLYCSS